MTTSGLRLREWRERRGWSLRELGQRSGVSYPNIRKIEVGIISPTVATLQSLADALGITVRDLFPTARTPSRKETTRTKTTTPRPRTKT
jgi:transcriptional regulator with XRE-family HTH domain